MIWSWRTRSNSRTGLGAELLLPAKSAFCFRCLFYFSPLISSFYLSFYFLSFFGSFDRCRFFFLSIYLCLFSTSPRVWFEAGEQGVTLELAWGPRNSLRNFSCCLFYLYVFLVSCFSSFFLFFCFWAFIFWATVVIFLIQLLVRVGCFFCYSFLPRTLHVLKFYLVSLKLLKKIAFDLRTRLNH